MEKIAFEIIKPYIISNPIVALGCLGAIILIFYIRTTLKMYERWLKKHDSKIQDIVIETKTEIKEERQRNCDTHKIYDGRIYDLSGRVNKLEGQSEPKRRTTKKR